MSLVLIEGESASPSPAKLDVSTTQESDSARSTAVRVTEGFLNFIIDLRSEMFMAESNRQTLS